MKNWEKRFDKKFGEVIDDGTVWRFNYSGINEVKQFINKEIERIFKGIIWDKEECYNTFDYEPDCGNCRSCYLNIKRQQIIKWAKEQGINIK